MVDSEQEVENTKELQLKKTIFNELTKLRRKKKRDVLKEADYKAIIKIDVIKKKASNLTWKKIQKLDIQNEADKFENHTLEFIKKMLEEEDSKKCFGTTIKKISGISVPQKLSIKTQRTSIDPDCVAVYQDTIFVIE